MKNRNNFFFLIILLFVASTAVQCQSKHFIWEVKSDKATVYLVGSVHMAKEDMYPLPKVMEDAFDKSQYLTVELDVSKANAMELMKKFTYQDSTTLQDHLSPKTYEKLKERFQKHNVPSFLYKKMKPGLALLTLMSLEIQGSGYKPELGIDMHFINKAKEKKKILELETIDFQINLFTEGLEGHEEAYLDYSLSDMDKSTESIDAMIKAWKEGDDKAMQKVINEDEMSKPEFKSFSEKILDQRNINMTEKILDYLKTDSVYFVVVGSAHIIGEKGIIELLRKKGFTVNQL